jgi:hypothetical protein
MGPRRPNVRAVQSVRPHLFTLRTSALIDMYRFANGGRRHDGTPSRASSYRLASARDGATVTYAIAATTCPGTPLEREHGQQIISMCEAMGGMQMSVNREGISQTSSVSSVSDAGSWPRSISWTRSCVSPSSCIASGFSTSSSSSWRWLGDRRILPPPSSSLSE